MGGKTPLLDFSIHQFREGDPKEFRRVYDTYYDGLYIFAHNLVKRDAEAQDITTETFIKLWRLRDTFKSLNNIVGFLYVASRNACIDHLRSAEKQRNIHEELLYLEASDEDIRNEKISAEVFRQLSQKISALPGKCRKIFELIYIDNLSTAEVAQRMGISNQNVLNQKARAIQILRMSLMAELGLIFLLLFL